MTDPVLSVRNLTVNYRLGAGAFSVRRGVVHAVDDVSLDVLPGRTLGLVGESGSGKTTLGRVLVGLVKPTAGTLLLDGQQVRFDRPGLKRLRSDVQMVFQSASASLNPRIKVAASIAEPMSIAEPIGRGARARVRVAELLELVGMDRSDGDKYPHQLSGGQQQRVGIARALAAEEPRLLICDEIVSGLDVSMQAQILKLLGRLQRELGLTYVFISHDLAVVRLFAADLAVMYRGRIVEQGTSEEIFSRPRNDYTKRLLAAVPLPDPRSERRRVTARPNASDVVTASSQPERE